MSKKSNKYTGNFKVKVVEDIKNNNLTYSEALKKNIPSHSTIMSWERIYLEEGKEALYEERRGRAKASDKVLKGRPIKLSKDIEDDLIKENQRLRMENEYLKKLEALVRSKRK